MAVKPIPQSLQDKMKAAVGGAAPSLTPGPRPLPPAKEVETLPDISEVIEGVADRLALKRLVADSVALAAQEKEIKAMRAPITNNIKNILAKYEVGKAMCGDARINFYTVPRSSLSKDLLLRAGVTPAVIAACTVTTQTATLRITVGQEDDGE